MQRHKAVGLWYEGDVLRVRAHLRDSYSDPDSSVLVLHEYRLDLSVDLADHGGRRGRGDADPSPLRRVLRRRAERGAPGGTAPRRGFTAEALRRLGGEVGCTHLNSLISDLSIAGLFHGYLRVRDQTRRHGVLPVMPASGERTGICAGWQTGGVLATWMEDGRGIAPSHIYPTGGAAPEEP